MKWDLFKKRRFIIGIAGAAFCLAVSAVISIWPVSRCSADLDGDGADDKLIVTRKFASRYGRELVIWTAAGKSVYDMKELMPLKVQAADIDGDGQKEISVMVYKKTRLDSEYKVRPFFYDWHPEGLSPRWLGSRLARPFDDFIFADMNGDRAEELIAIEKTPEGGRLINAYRWSDFGFTSIGQSAEFDDVNKIICGEYIEGRGYDISAKVKLENRWMWTSLFYDGKDSIYSQNDEN